MKVQKDVVLTMFYSFKNTTAMRRFLQRVEDHYRYYDFIYNWSRGSDCISQARIYREALEKIEEIRRGFDEDICFLTAKEALDKGSDL